MNLRSWALVLIASCSPVGDPCDHACVGLTPPAQTCRQGSAGEVVTYGSATCEVRDGAAVCGFTEVHTPCIYAANQICYGNRCGNPEGNPNPCVTVGCISPYTSCADASTLATSLGVCSGLPGQSCGYTVTSTTSCNTPPPASCVGAVLTTYVATGTCVVIAVSHAECRYAATTVDCTATNQVCQAATASCVP